MTADIPTGSIAAQSLTTPPIPVDSTLVDDPVALVDDPVSLVGSQTTIYEGIRTNATISVPRPFIKINR